MGNANICGDGQMNCLNGDMTIKTAPKEEVTAKPKFEYQAKPEPKIVKGMTK
jgi:hypothetical protein